MRNNLNVEEKKLRNKIIYYLIKKGATYKEIKQLYNISKKKIKKIYLCEIKAEYLFSFNVNNYNSSIKFLSVYSHILNTDQYNDFLNGIYIISQKKRVKK